MKEQEFNKEIGAKLKAMRKASKKTRKDIAKLFDIGVDYVGKIERGERPITAFMLTEWVLFLDGAVTIGGSITVPNTISLQQKKPEG